MYMFALFVGILLTLFGLNIAIVGLINPDGERNLFLHNGLAALLLTVAFFLIRFGVM